MLIERNFNKDKIFVLYNGIDKDKKFNFIPKEDFLSRYNINYNGEFLVGIAARLDKVKDHQTFIAACKEVLKENTDIIFLIAGEGEEKDNLLKEIKGFEKNIYFLDFVKDNYSFFNAIDLNVLTSISESFPYVILESALMNVASISTDVGGISKVIINDKTGYLIGVCDYKSLSQKILYLYNNRQKLKELGENIHKLVEEKFSTDAMGKAQFEIYNKILEEYNENNW